MYTISLNKVYFESDYLEEEFCLLENLILLLKSNVESFNDASSKLYEVLIDIHRFLLGLYPNVLLRKLHLLQASFQSILDHSIPIVCSCYLEHREADILDELNSVLNLIKHIKYEVLEIKLDYFPRVDDLGFLEYFSGYLEDLMKNHEISTKGEIEALHFEFHSLLSLAKVTNEGELNKTTWTDIINLAYQAEYIIDLYLVSSSKDLGLSSLFKIIGLLVGFKAELYMIDLINKNLCLPEKVAATSKPQVLGTATQVSDNGAIVGLQEEVKIIMEYLLKSEDKLDVISIVGMAGVGKTTLALTLYKIPSVTDHFDILSWCPVSQSYRNRDLLLVVLDQVNALNKNHRDIWDDQELADHLCRSLKKRKYLIVLDDIWDTTLLNYLRSCLPDDRNGSRILITTRNRDVADQIGSKVNELHGLSEEISWELFQKKLLQKESLSDNLLKISKGIVEHCKGLPLSIVLIAGILSDIERTDEKWNQIAESVSFLILSESQGKGKAILELSYNQLPNQLRSCFLYMGSFPEDQEISVSHLIGLWIAEGLVRDTKSDSAEEVANKYMDYLIVKSLVIPTRERSRGGVKCFRLHDLLRDFCLDKAKEQHFFTLLDKRNYSRPLQDPRRLLISLPRINGMPFSCHSIRSMICFHELEASEIEKFIESCDMVLVKVLEVRHVLSHHFPNISSLFHLRYLALGFQNREISVLPSAISKLQNLQILILRCTCLVMKVPDSIWDMVRLRLVDISPEASFQIDSKRLQNSSFLLENLRSLSKVRVSCDDSKWLSKLSRLERVSCVIVDDDLKDNQFPILSFTQHLTALKVENATSGKQNIIRTCELPISLQELTLSKFYLTSNDISLIGRSLPRLEVFKIYSCSVPSGCKWNMDDGDFPRLTVLKLRSLEIYKWIASENSFPMLEQLWMKKCYYLDQIPLDFGYLPKLNLISVRDCHLPVNNSAREIEKMQHAEQNTEMRAYIFSER